MDSSWNPALSPTHVGMIMDGNGRWARAQGMARSEGHKEGLKAAKRVTKAASDLGVKFLSLYVFSTENWKRAEQEVSFLMFLLKSHLLKEWDFYRDNRIKVVHSGYLEGLPKDVQADLLQVQHDTAHFDGLTVNLAINYGGQDEILRAIKRWSADPQKPQELTAGTFKNYLDQPQLPPVDLMVRTAGEARLSNFLLWQSVYAEYYFSPKLWPDWNETDLLEALRAFNQRHRKFGGLHGE
ncbi:MAG: di-trans,poly-cis-decaprenylcistransferase [Spirochaetales bacterium]|nr:di-trans,poly-cis-decaprenylcistransferase [Spirochaetales bacterium]